MGEIFWKPAFQFLYDLGLFDVVLPFILVFTVVFAILEKTKILGQEKDKPRTKLNSIIALCLGLLTVGVLELTNAITMLSQYMAFAFVGVMLLAMLAAFLSSQKIENKTFGVVVGIIALGLLAVLALPVQGLFIMRWLRDIIPWLIIILFFLGVIWYIMHTKTQAKPAAQPKKEEEEEDEEKQPKLELDEDTKENILSDINNMSDEEKIIMLQKAMAFENALAQQERLRKKAKK